MSLIERLKLGSELKSTVSHSEYNCVNCWLKWKFNVLMTDVWVKESGEKQAQLDRALREKRSVEAELEKVYHEGILDSGRESRDVNELSQRACAAERSRDEAQMKADSLANQLRRTEAL